MAADIAQPPPDETTSLLAKSTGSSDSSTFSDESLDGIVRKDDVEETRNSALRVVFPILLLGVFLANAVGAVVLATNQHIASEFDALSSAAWLLTIYTLAQCASQPLYGKLCDIFGRRSLLSCCWLLFVFGDVVVATTRTYGQALTGRAISGIGSAGMISMASVIVADLVPIHQLATYRAYINVTATTARSFGGPLGAWAAGSFSWRWCFLVPCPLTLLGLGLVLYHMPAPVDDTRDQEDPSAGKASSKLHRVDFLGAATVVGFILCFLLLLDRATKGAPLILIIPLAAGSTIFLTAFVVVEKHYAAEPILPLDLISKRDVCLPYLIVGCKSASQFTLLYSIPLYFIAVEHTSISQAGTRIAPVVIGNAIASILSGRLIARTQRYKLLTVIAILTALFGWTLIFLRWNGNVNPWETLYVILPGFGMGTIQSSTFVHIAASLPRSDMAIAGTAWFLAQSFGYLFGASFSTALINGVLKRELNTRMEGRSDRVEIIKLIMSSIDNVRKLPEAIQTLTAEAYVVSLHWAYALSMFFLVLALLFTLLLKEKRMDGR